MSMIDLYGGRTGLSPRLSMIFGTAAVLVVAACAAPNIVDEQPARTELAPIEQPDWQPGMAFREVDIRTGAERTWTILAVEDGVFSAQSNDGCAWSNRVDWFPPALSWDNCGANADWSKGVRTITGESGQMWPLQVGRTASHNHSYETLVTGAQDSGVQTCEIPATVRISVAAGEVDAYKVVCTDRRRSGSELVRTWYWAPDLGIVRFTNWSNRRGVEVDSDVSRIGS